jgi:hypothetical protein
LTAANHLFPFDRWWNPTVENQATDRALRIGQKSNVQVHKFICVGTLEEKIDKIIETKRQIAGSIIGTGGDWLTKPSTAELKDLLTLRDQALADEDLTNAPEIFERLAKKGRSAHSVEYISTVREQRRTVGTLRRHNFQRKRNIHAEIREKQR